MTNAFDGLRPICRKYGLLPHEGQALLRCKAPADILGRIETWRDSQGLPANCPLTRGMLAQFIQEASPPVFPCGARVLVDGRDEAVVKQAFPNGSSSFLFAHYKVDIVGGDRNVAVGIDRVGVERGRR
jgi:hypothetical protein